MSSSLNPFECPICFDFYDMIAHVPTTLSCGHSCCIAHFPRLKACPICRGKIDKICAPNVALRDGSIEYQKIIKAKSFSPTKVSTSTMKIEQNDHSILQKTPIFKPVVKIDNGFGHVDASKDARRNQIHYDLSKGERTTTDSDGQRKVRLLMSPSANDQPAALLQKFDRGDITEKRHTLIPVRTNVSSRASNEPLFTWGTDSAADSRDDEVGWQPFVPGHSDFRRKVRVVIVRREPQTVLPPVHVPSLHCQDDLTLPFNGLNLGTSSSALFSTDTLLSSLPTEPAQKPSVWGWEYGIEGPKFNIGSCDLRQRGMRKIRKGRKFKNSRV